MKTIIAPTDFSEVSVNAVNYAADMAMALHAQLIIMHVNEYIYAYSEAGIIDALIDEKTDERLDGLEMQLLKRTANKLSIKKVMSVGRLEKELNKLSEAITPFAVVMGTHNELNTVNRFFLDSRSLNTTKKLRSPVMIIPQHKAWSKITSIAYACDLKDVESIPAEQIKYVQEAFGATLHVVHISKDSNFNSEDVANTMLLPAGLMVNKTDFNIIEHDDVVKGIEAFADEFKIDLIILQLKEYGFFENLFHVSQSKRMILHPWMPIMVLR
ncbi:universal stress protein [Parafilimonas sp.]|uniref:universal stress protein n=1 Tax=Parafilimonas sp. TaxID=1969739 RepID=UPI003F817A4C